MKKMQKCFFAMIAGFLWIVYLIKNHSEDFDGLGVESIFIACGVVLPIGIPKIFLQIPFDFKINSFLFGFLVYLLCGLVANLSIRSENGGSGFLPEPYIFEGKVFI